MEDEPIYLSTADLARRWRMQPGTLRNWRSRGIGPKYLALNGKNGRKKYKLADVEEWEQTHELGATDSEDAAATVGAGEVNEENQ